jgi:hypothetical protein
MYGGLKPIGVTDKAGPAKRVFKANLKLGEPG